MLEIEYKTKFDKEYSTQYTNEVFELARKGIRYTFVKNVDGLSTYKYTKNRELFLALAEFYKEK